MQAPSNDSGISESHPPAHAAVILHMGPTGLGIARSLGRLGIEVYGVDWNGKAPGLVSRYCHRQVILPNPVEDPQACVDGLLALGRERDHKAVLIPAADYYVSLISEHADALGEYFLFNIPAPDIVETITDKGRQYESAEGLGIAIAKTYAPQSLEDIDANQDDYSFPIVVKGVSSHQWQTGFGHKAFVAQTMDELRDYYQRAADKNIPAVLQEMIVGPNRNHFKVCAYYSREKELLALFTTQKARQFPVNFGVGTYMVSRDLPELAALGRKFFEGIGYTGCGSIEFKRDERDGRFRLIELNPRFWQQNSQATAAGLNFPHIYYRDCIGEQVDPCLRHEENVCWLDFAQDLRSFLKNRKRGEITLSEWIRALRSAACHAYYAPGDGKPALRRMQYILRRAFGGA